MRVRVIWHVPLGLTVVRAVVRAVCRMWEGTLQWARENCPELLYRLQLAAEQEEQQL